MGSAGGGRGRGWGGSRGQRQSSGTREPPPSAVSLWAPRLRLIPNASFPFLVLTRAKRRAPERRKDRSSPQIPAETPQDDIPGACPWVASPPPPPRPEPAARERKGTAVERSPHAPGRGHQPGPQPVPSGRPASSLRRLRGPAVLRGKGLPCPAEARQQDLLRGVSATESRESHLLLWGRPPRTGNLLPLPPTQNGVCRRLFSGLQGDPVHVCPRPQIQHETESLPPWTDPWHLCLNGFSAASILVPRGGCAPTAPTPIFSERTYPLPSRGWKTRV